MKAQIAIAILSFLSFSAYCYEGPRPLKDIKVELSSTLNTLKGVYTYKYKVTNPSTNDGEIVSINILVGRNPENDADVSSDGLSYCSPHNSKRSSAMIFAKIPMVAVGSDAPKGWSCGYGVEGNGNYGWGSVDRPNRIKPGFSQEGYILTSRGIPGIREIFIEPAIDLESLPEEYDENVDKTIALENKVKWMGKTIGPKAPPKVFNATQFLQDLVSAKNQAVTLGWIKNSGIIKSLEAKLDAAKKKLEAGDKNAAKNILNAFLNEVEAQKGKQLSNEAYALLFFNGKYLINHL